MPPRPTQDQPLDRLSVRGVPQVVQSSMTVSTGHFTLRVQDKASPGREGGAVGLPASVERTWAKGHEGRAYEGAGRDRREGGERCGG
jgi:hypothetical protein